MRTLSLCLCACLLVFTSLAQSVKRIRLSIPKQATYTSAIRVVAVVDDREDTATIGTMRAGLANKVKAVGLADGVSAAIENFINRYQRAAADAVPVTMHIRQLDISEQAMSLKERLTIKYNYAFVKEAGELAYEGSAYAESNMDVSPYIERLVRESLTGTFDKVADAWKDARSTAKPTVSISVKIEPQPASTGLLSYDRARPLGFNDFKGVADDLSLGAAATYTGISFAYSAQQTGSDFKIIVTLSAIADPEKSWIRDAGRSPRVLAHENLHFAITAMMACRLADTLRSLPVTKDDYDTKLRQAFNAIDRQLEQLQRRYDQETDHGRKPQEQAAWEAKIIGELKRAACYGH